jgi:hypothetical protein
MICPVLSAEPSSTITHFRGFNVWETTAAMVPGRNASSFRTGVMII